MLTQCSFADFHKFLWENELDGTTSSFNNTSTHYGMAQQLLHLLTNLRSANRNIQWFVVPNDMYWPWLDETQAHRQLFNAETNDIWKQDKSPLAMPREPQIDVEDLEEGSSDKLANGKPQDLEEVTGDELADDISQGLDPRGLFSVYSYRLITRQLSQAQIALEKSTEASLVNKNYEKFRDDSKMWPMAS